MRRRNASGCKQPGAWLNVAKFFRRLGSKMALELLCVVNFLGLHKGSTLSTVFLRGQGTCTAFSKRIDHCACVCTVGTLP